ncbi:MAG: gamma-glutamylcyclotransferase [Pseudomonadota bacterium]
MTARRLTLTDDHVARIERPVEDQGPRADLTPMTGEDFEAAARRFLTRIEGRPFWLFAYGSLIWNPAFEHLEHRRATAHGWRRSFCLHMTNWRATQDRPGLMLALDRGGSCLGVAYRLPDEDRRAQMVRLLKRETRYHEDLPWIRFIPLRSGGERLTALVFYAAPSTPDGDLIRLPEAEQVRRLARAVGHRGSCAAYLLNTVRRLEDLGIHDRYLWRLQRLVAEEIETLGDRLD